MNILLNFRKNIKIKKKNLPDSKSIINRIIFITSFIKKKKITFNKVSFNKDIEIMIEVLKNLGKKISIKGKKINIKGKKKINIKKKYLNIKNSGITARLITTLLIIKANKKVIIDGTKRMRQRPINETIEICNKIKKGIKIKWLIKKNFLPIKIYKKKFALKKRKIKVKSIKSSQSITSLLLITPIIIKKKIVIYIKKTVSKPYIELVISLMKKFGINIKRIKKKIILKKSNYCLENKKVKKLIEKDNSALIYIIFNKMIIKKNIYIKSKTLKSTQKEIKIIKILTILGYVIKKKNKTKSKILLSNSDNKKRKNTGIVKFIKINCSEIIDSAMILVILIFKKIKKIKLYNIYNWNYKESKRIKTIKNEIKKIGILAKSGSNWIILKKNKNNLKKKILINSYEDHRIFMVFFQTLGLGLKTIINTPNNIKKTFPLFLKNEK